MRVDQHITVMHEGEPMKAVVLTLPMSVSRRFEWRECNEEYEDAEVPPDHYFHEGTALVDLRGVTWDVGWDEDTGVALRAAFTLWKSAA